MQLYWMLDFEYRTLNKKMSNIEGRVVAITSRSILDIFLFDIGHLKLFLLTQLQNSRTFRFRHAQRR